MREISKMMISTVTIGFTRVSVVAAQAGRLPRFSFARSSAGSWYCCQKVMRQAARKE
jgi:hypothetical protein